MPDCGPTTHSAATSAAALAIPITYPAQRNLPTNTDIHRLDLDLRVTLLDARRTHPGLI
ncbi:hypothetical protein ACG74X_13125 [Marivita sp. S0852]|uniref:hypothetical protein n=1 Tax=Marivita sp. S0852 TaxID=3373893 RepID=UPI0039824101